jgi:lipopolysaccharide/colanic/teichoic acid biosynthesis glycosyltransferase
MSRSSQGSVSQTPTLEAPSVVAEGAGPRRARGAERGQPAIRYEPLSQELFLDALVRERKRADRFEGALVLVRISFDSREAQDVRSKELVEALSRAALATDVIGWLEQDAVLGLIRSLAEGNPEDTATALADAVWRDLARRLTPGNVNRCSIGLEIYAPANGSPPVLPDGPHQRRNPRQVARDAAKRLLDIAGSAAFLIAFSPVFLLVAILVKLTSKGPVFFPQERVGEAGRPFRMLKFRTMHVNADHGIHRQYVENFIQSSQTAGAGKNVVFKIVNDPRVTPLGHFLRQTSLDEFPQFWNVFKGEMSLVGPRPPLSYEVARYKRWHRRRVLEAKPGITGLWQVTGRSRTTFDEMVRLDLRYAKHYSVWTDLKILMATPRAVLSGKGAH